jgi:hypothetical protein
LFLPKLNQTPLFCIICFEKSHKLSRAFSHGANQQSNVRCGGISSRSEEFGTKLLQQLVQQLQRQLAQTTAAGAAAAAA